MVKLDCVSSLTRRVLSPPLLHPSLLLSEIDPPRTMHTGMMQACERCSSHMTKVLSWTPFRASFNRNIRDSLPEEAIGAPWIGTCTLSVAGQTFFFLYSSTPDCVCSYSLCVGPEGKTSFPSDFFLISKFIFKLFVVRPRKAEEIIQVMG